MSTLAEYLSIAGVEPAFPGLPAATEQSLIREAVEAAFRLCDRLGYSPSMATFAVHEAATGVYFAVKAMLPEPTESYTPYKRIHAAVASAFYNDLRYVPQLPAADDLTEAIRL